MNKETYINELSIKLADLAQNDREDAIAYCQEYFDEAGLGNEEQVIQEIGTPSKFAAQIKAEAAIKKVATLDKNPKTGNQTFKNVGTIILGICALPLALPLSITVVALLFSFIVVVLCLLFAGVLSVGAILFSGIPLIVSGIANMGNPTNAFIAIGGGLLAIGVGFLLSMVLILLIKIAMKFFTKAITSFYQKIQGGRRNEKK